MFSDLQAIRSLLWQAVKAASFAPVSFQFYTQDWGAAGKPPLILVHGLASSSHIFDLTAPLLADDFHVLAFDQRGHGQSDKPDSGYDFATIAADLERVIAALGFGSQKVTLAGHSWGAATVLTYAAARPEQVSGVILIDGARSPSREHFPNLEAMRPPQRRNWPLADVKRMIREDWLGPNWRPELEPLVLAIYDQSNPNDVRPYLRVENHMQIAAALWDFTPSEVLPRVQCPILRINAISEDAPDAAQRAASAEEQRRCRDLETVWMADSIHDLPLQRPEALAKVMRTWLERQR